MGTIINVITIILGGLIELFFRERFPERIAQTALQLMGLFTLVVGIQMALQGKELILILISLAGGAVLGELIRIEDRLDRLGKWIEKSLKVTEGSPAKGFIYASLVFAVGSMAIVGSITDGAGGDYSILLTKAMMDGIISIPFAAGMGPGVLGSAVTILVYQGSLTLMAKGLQSFFNPVVINELTAVGGVLVMGIGINILGLQKIKVANFLPALALIIVFTLIWV
jgi:uncharacterized membrane protein YqgA involved in biofilm formation